MEEERQDENEQFGEILVYDRKEKKKKKWEKIGRVEYNRWYEEIKRK